MAAPGESTGGEGRMRGLERVALALCLAAAVAASPGSRAGAQEAPPAIPPAAPAAPAARDAGPEGQGLFGLMLHIGGYAGTGAGVQLGGRSVGVRLSGGWAPVLLAVVEPDQDPRLKLYSGFLAAPDLYVRFTRSQSGTDVGAQAGYSTLLGSGWAAGIYVRFPLGKVDGLIAGGLLVFPDGEARIADREKLPSGTSFSFPGAAVNVGISLGLLFLP
jgi:hypothetical protein